MKIWSTKYCLTDGITEHEVSLSADMAKYTPEGSFTIYLHGEGKNWHRTREGAVLRAEEVRIKKLQSLDKQMKRISARVF